MHIIKIKFTFLSNMSFFLRCFAHHKASIFVVFILTIIGINIYLKIPRELNPDVKIAFLHVMTSLQGISVEDSEKLLLRPLEKHLKVVSGIKEMTSIASKGSAFITLEFDAGYSIDKALADVRAKVDLAKNDLPQDANAPTVKEINMAELPILSVALLGETIPDNTMQKISEKLKERLQTIPEVLDVDVVGKKERVIEIIIDQKTLDQYQLTFEEVAQIMRVNNMMITAGQVMRKNGAFTIEIDGTVNNALDILQFPIRFDPDVPLKIGDVAQILQKTKTPTKTAKFDNQSAIVLKISKKTGSNLLLTIAKVKYLLNEAKSFLPPNLEIRYSQDTSEKVLNVLSDLENNVIFAIFLVFIIILKFLGLRPALFIAMSIPISFLMSIIVLYLLGYTLNIVVLFSLILSVGILVDNAIVIVEFAQKRLSFGDDKVSAFKIAISSMTTPLISSTATTVVVFLPLMFWPGMMGKFMFFLPVTLISTLCSSLISALIFIPAFGRIFAKKSSKAENSALEEGNFIGLNFFYRRYHQILSRILAAPKKFIALIICASIGIIFLYAMLGRGVEFFPDVEPDNAFLEVKALGNLSLYEKSEIVEKVEQIVHKYDAELKNTFTEIGEINEDVIGRIIIEFADWKTRRKAKEIMRDLRNEIKDFAGFTVDISLESKMGDQKAIRVDVLSQNYDLVKKNVQMIKNLMTQLGGFVDVEDTGAIQKIAFDVQIDRSEAAKYGLTVAQIGSVVQMITDEGLKIMKYYPDDSEDEVDIVLKLPQDRNLVTEVKNLKINTKQFGIVPISNFITVNPKKSDSKMTKIGGVNAISVKSNVEEGLVVDNQVKQLQKALKNQAIDQSVTIDFAGENRDQQETMNFLKNAFLIAISLVILIIVIQFNSFFDAFAIMTAVFFSTIGVYLGLLLTGRPFGVVMCGVGIVTLVGVVVNNNIILIDAYHHNVQKGMARFEAVMVAAMSRLRPILLTAGTTILGLMPMIFCTSFNFFELEVNVGAPSGQWWTQLSTSIGGGLLFATIITLFFTPALLMLREVKE